MSISLIAHPATWAMQHFGTVALGDRRLNQRVVQLAAALLRRPDASLPRQLPTVAALKATYRLLAHDGITHQALATPHWEQTRQAARQQQLVLFVQDTTELDYSHHPATTGLGPIGNDQGRGRLLHSTLAILPAARTILGLAAQEPLLRHSVPEARGRGAHTRRHRARESQVWERALIAIGSPPPGACWLHVGDRYADIFDWMECCRAQQCHFLIRAAQDRRVQAADAPASSVMTLARTLTAQDQQHLSLPARPKRPARQATLKIAWQAVQLQPPAHSRQKAPLSVWIIRVWESAPPADGEPLEWILLTSLPTNTVAEAWERRDWYCCRWLIEAYHQCLKTGCQVEQRQLQTAEGLMRLLGLLGPIATQLLQLRELARQDPEALAAARLPADLVQVVAALAAVAPETLSVQQFWHAVARQGGYVGRRRDGPPGWRTLWQGWLYVQAVLDGVHLAAHLPP